MKTAILLTALAAILIGSISIALALTITNVDSPILKPGEQGSLIVEVENNLNDDIEDVSFSLDLTALPISAVGSSEDIIDEINEDDDGKFSFTLRVAVDAKPGDYKIPYTLNYKDLAAPRKGTIGIKINAKSDLDFSISTENPVIGQQGKITLKIINKGLADARFVSLSVQQNGFTILSEEQVYIGNIDSDDFEIASFDVIFKTQKARLVGTLEYLDFDNKKQVRAIDLPIKTYTKEKALELGIIKKSNTGVYIGIIIVLVIIWIVYRSVRKRLRMKKSMQKANGS